MSDPPYDEITDEYVYERGKRGGERGESTLPVATISRKFSDNTSNKYLLYATGFWAFIVAFLAPIITNKLIMTYCYLSQ